MSREKQLLELPSQSQRMPRVRRSEEAPPEHANPPSAPPVASALRQPGAAIALQRAAGNRVVRRLASEDAFDAPPEAEAQIESQRGHGAPLDEPMRREMEGASGADLSAVRVHNDDDSAALAQGLQARAFTQGSDIYFGAGEYAPASDGGRRVLAHEVAHVVQQTPGAKLLVGSAHDPAETEADQMADQMVSRMAQGAQGTQVVQRQETPKEEAQLLRRQPRPEDETEAVTQVVDEEEPPTPGAQEGPTQAPGAAAPAAPAAAAPAAQEVTGEGANASPRAQFAQGEAAYRQGDYSGALEIFRRLTESPNLPASARPALIYDMAMCHLRMGNREAATATFNEYLAQPNITPGDRAQAERRIAELTGRPEGEQNVGAQVEQAEGAPGSANAAPQAAPTEVGREEPLPTDPVARGRALFTRGSAAYGAGDYTTALRLFEQILNTPNYPPHTYAAIVYDIGCCHERLGDQALALQWFRKFLAQPGITTEERAQVEARIARLAGATGESQAVGGRVDEGAGAGGATAPGEQAAAGANAPAGPATEAARAAPLPTEPRARAQALFGQGQAAYVAGRYAEALEQFELVLSISGLDPQVHNAVYWNCARCHQRLGNNAAALALLRAFQRQPDVSEADRTAARNLIAELQR